MTDFEVRKVDMIRNRVRGGHGYLMIDDRNSGGELKQYDTLTCAHCNAIVVLNPNRIRLRAWCYSCNAYVCDDKACARDCYSILRCIDLILTDPTIPALPRTKDGELLFNPELLQKGRPF